MKYTITLTLLIIACVCSAQYESLKEYADDKKFSYTKTKLTIYTDKGKLHIENDKYSHDIPVSKTIAKDFEYHAYTNKWGTTTMNIPVEDMYVRVDESNDVGFYLNGKRIARIDLMSKDLRTIKIPYRENYSYDICDRTFENNMTAYFVAIPRTNSIDKHIYVYEFNFESEEYKILFKVKTLSNDDYYDVELQGDILFMVDIKNGIQFYDIKSKKVIRHIKPEEFFPPIVLKDLDKMNSTRLSFSWFQNNPLLRIRFAELKKWDYEFEYWLRSGMFDDEEYEKNGQSRDALSMIWVDDKYMYYKVEEYRRKAEYIEFPAYQKDVFKKNCSKASFKKYMRDFYDIHAKRQVIYNENKNTNKLFPAGSRSYKDEVNALPELFINAKWYYFVNKQDDPKNYKWHKKERAAIGEEGKAEIDSLIPILMEEYNELKMHNNAIQLKNKDKVKKIRLFSDTDGQNLVYEFDQATKITGVLGKENQVKVWKYNEYGPYVIIFDLLNKEVVSTERKTDF